MVALLQLLQHVNSTCLVHLDCIATTLRGGSVNHASSPHWALAMTQPSSRPPNLLQPRLKAAPTFSSSILAATASTTPQVSRASSRTREPDIERPLPPVDTSDKTTASLIRRILRPHTHSTGDRNIPRPISEILPPLTSSNDVDLQLYAIIAIVIKEFVFSWYAKITPDHVFVEEVVRIIAHCTRALEGRLRGVDLEELLLDEIPELVERHVLGKA